MMGSEEEEEDWFSDAREEVSDYNSQVEVEVEEEDEEFVQASGDLELWTMNPDSVSNRRNKFFESMGFSFKKRGGHVHIGDDDDVIIPLSQPLNSVSETDHHDEEEKLLRNESISSSSQSVSSLSTSSSSRSRGGPFLDRAKHIDDRIFLTRDCSTNSDSSSSSSIALSESGGSSSSRSADFHQNSSSRSSEDYSPKKGGGGGGATGWLKKLGVLTHVLDKNEEDSVESNGSRRRQLTRVQSFKKQFKELSSLCIGQEFSAHDGSILVMKFSHDGNYLATAGEDSVVRVWTITQEERRDNLFEVVADSDSTSNSLVYFGMNDKSQIEPLNIENEKVEKSRSLLLRKKSESTCAVLPPKVFTISETPLHEFQGHAGEILDLSWSDKGFLLSSSVDETVRLWRVGSSDDECLRVFSHKSFVTCVAFNPVDDNYFISGSTDGKVRIWDVSRFRVVDYTDIKEIVTALCYRPDAKGVVVGSMTGDCLFYHTIDNQLELDKEISLHGGKKKKKNKVPSKRITGFQFFPGDSDKLMVTSADSQIRVISGVDTICKLKKASSLRTTLSPTSALFTSDGKHIVSTIEDSGIHVWDYSQPNKKAVSPPKPKTIRSYEGFLSDNVSVAIPWLGQGKEEDSVCSFIADLDKKFAHLPLPVRDCFSQLKGATTWPEEKLGLVAGSAAAAISATASSRSKLRLLRSVCQNVNNTCTPHLWGLVIVTATWDGRIRVFHNYGLPIRV